MSLNTVSNNNVLLFQQLRPHSRPDLEQLYGVKFINGDEEAQAFIVSARSVPNQKVFRVRATALNQFPDFTKDALVVRTLVFDDCRFQPVNESVSSLSSLTHLHLRYCEILTRFPLLFLGASLTYVAITGEFNFLFVIIAYGQVLEIIMPSFWTVMIPQQYHFS